MSANWDRALSAIDGWHADNAVAVVVGPEGVRASRGDVDRVYQWASITKLVTALAALVAVDAGVLDLAMPAGPPGSTLAHLLAHASGLDFDSEAVLARPGTRRIYSNPGYDRIGALLAERDGTTFDQAIRIRVLGPVGMTTTEVVGRPSGGLAGPAADLVAFARELLRPTRLRPATYRAMTEVAFPGLAGVLPGLGRYDPLDWGLGPELRDGKGPHWTGTLNSPRTFGHFGGAGTFLWIDPALDIGLVCLTDRPFDAWALDAWPVLSDAVIRAATSTGDADAPAAR